MWKRPSTIFLSQRGTSHIRNPSFSILRKKLKGRNTLFLMRNWLNQSESDTLLYHYIVLSSIFKLFRAKIELFLNSDGSKSKLELLALIALDYFGLCNNSSTKLEL